MPELIIQAMLEKNFAAIGIKDGDSILVRAGLSTIGKTKHNAFIDALLNVIGNSGTISSLAFTSNNAFPWQAHRCEPFTQTTKSYAGALPNAMLKYPGAQRSKHPQCSFVAIGRHAEYITSNHGPDDGAYEPIRRLMELNGKMLVVGCVASSPGFTTTHLAEVDLKMHWRIMPLGLIRVSRYVDDNGVVKIFKRRDPGFCSNSYWKFYAYYVQAGILQTGYVGQAYSIIAPAQQCYEIEKNILAKNPHFNICDSPDCAMCNALRYDRIHKLPGFIIRKLSSIMRK